MSDHTVPRALYNEAAMEQQQSLINSSFCGVRGRRTLCECACVGRESCRLTVGSRNEHIMWRKVQLNVPQGAEWRFVRSHTSLVFQKQPQPRHALSVQQQQRYSRSVDLCACAVFSRSSSTISKIRLTSSNLVLSHSSNSSTRSK